MHTEGDGFRPKEATSGTSILKHVFGGVSVGTVCTQVSDLDLKAWKVVEPG